MEIKLKGLSYSFDENGEVASALVRFEQYANEEYLHANVKLELADMGEEGFNQLPKQMEAIAKAKIKEWF